VRLGSERTDVHASITRRQGAVAGLVAGGLAVAIGMLLAVLADVVSPIDAVGSAFIDRTPRWLKEWAIRSFGADDKLVLRAGIVIVLAVAAAIIGRAASSRPWVAVVGFAVFGIVGALAGSALASIIGAAVGAAVLVRLVRPTAVEVPGPSRAPLGWDRRRFLVTSGAVALGAGVVARLIDQSRIDDVRAKASGPLPTNGPIDSAPGIPATATLDPATPFITPVGSFYRIDTALSFPRVDAGGWTVDIAGMVDHPVRLNYADILAMPQVERVVTLCCVSNDVGGDYIGNAVWRGVLLSHVLDRVGVRPGAQQVFSTSIDGWTCGFPLEVARDGRDAMIAVGMNGDTLPLEHGYPARLVVPGLYGYVSATKWLQKIELTTWDQEGYWIPRGWGRLGPVKTQSRIDVPRNGSSVAVGPQKIAGVAWAQHRGITKVEIRVDNGPWQLARLGTDVSNDTWRQWVVDWDAPKGRHAIEVRATDGTGTTQTADRTDVAPDGATGHHTIHVQVG
jgi:DMSO/TMAO reductase YedYZ molybdopterin-dependent catalytic subunit